MSEAVMNKNASGVYQAIPAFDCDEQMVTVYGPHDNYLERTQVIYERAKSEFNSLKMGDPQILELAERWRVVAVQLMRTACGFFGKLNRTDETRARALQIMDMVTKDSASRSSSVSRYYDLLEGKFPEQKEMLRIVEKADLKHLEVVDRMIRTQISYIEPPKTCGRPMTEYRKGMYIVLHIRIRRNVFLRINLCRAGRDRSSVSRISLLRRRSMIRNWMSSCCRRDISARTGSSMTNRWSTIRRYGRSSSDTEAAHGTGGNTGRRGTTGMYR